MPTWTPGTINVLWLRRTRSAIARLGLSAAYFIRNMMPLAHTWEAARTVALLALNSAMNGTDSETTSVRITTAASNRIDLR